MAYSTTQSNLVEGAEAVRPARPPRLVRNLALDYLALPVIRLTPRRHVEALGARIPTYFDFGQRTWRTERLVEIPLAMHALEISPGAEVLEVGNVLAASGIVGHTVVDKYEVGDGVLNVDVLDYSPERRFDLAISISTVEHIGFDEHPQELDKAGRALMHIAEIADRLLVTIPVGCNPDAEAAMIDGPFDRVELLVKTSRLGQWEQRDVGEATRVRYHVPYFCGNGILVGSRGLASNV